MMLADELDGGVLNWADLHVRPPFYPSSISLTDSQAIDSHMDSACYNFPFKESKVYQSNEAQY